MKKLILSMLIFIAWATSLSAQITREQADKIVLEYFQNEVTSPYFLYVNTNAPSEAGIAITTFQEETFTAKYPCWAYYLNEFPEITEPAQHRYLFVKENDGNLLEVITSNDMIPDLTAWEEVSPMGIVETQSIVSVRIYPNPTDSQLTIDNGELTIENVEIFDLMGKTVGAYQFPSFGGAGVVNVSHLPVGVYFIRITTENETITQKIIKN